MRGVHNQEQMHIGWDYNCHVHYSSSIPAHRCPGCRSRRTHRSRQALSRVSRPMGGQRKALLRCTSVRGPQFVTDNLCIEQAFNRLGSKSFNRDSNCVLVFSRNDQLASLKCPDDLKAHRSIDVARTLCTCKTTHTN